ncbi:MAG: hypothetical protein H8D46_00200 [FCB group bacterium]|nr:hypothetical protein [FCB group bacterium]
MRLLLVFLLFFLLTLCYVGNWMFDQERRIHPIRYRTDCHHSARCSNSIDPKSRSAPQNSLNWKNELQRRRGPKSGSAPIIYYPVPRQQNQHTNKNQGGWIESIPRDINYKQEL